MIHTKKMFSAIVFLSLAMIFINCNGNDPDNSTSDPEGTVQVFIRNYNNGGTVVELCNGNLFINEADNFESYIYEFVDIGKVKGLIDVAKIPQNNVWAYKVSVIPGHGYILRSTWKSDETTFIKYARMYVVRYMEGAEKAGIIGAEIKYQCPFEPTKLELSSKSLAFTQEGGMQSITVNTDALWNYEIITIDVPWLTVSKSGDKLNVSVKSNESVNARDALITINANEKQEVITVEQQKWDKQTNAPYKVGDIYNENGVTGMVYKVTDNGTHGMILSMKYSTEAWSKSNTLTNASDENNGMNNMNTIKKLDDWQNRFPAFAWCDNMNQNGVVGWYLPSINELKYLYAAYNGLSEYPGSNVQAPILYGETRQIFEAALNKGGAYGILNSVTA